MKKIVIVGGGIAGKILAGSLSREKGADTVLVEPKEYLEVPFAQLRALVEPETFSPGIRKPYAQILPGVEHIRKYASGIQEKTLLLKDGSAIGFDYLVIATGSRFISWPYLKNGEPSMEARQKEVESEGNKLKAASSVLIIGGGPVGVELAGEIAYKWPEKQIKILEGGSRILSGMSRKAADRAEKLLKGMGVEIQSGTHLRADDSGTWRDDKGTAYKADIVYPAVGISIDSTWLDGDAALKRTDRGAIIVDPYLRAEGFKDIFALGDVNDVAELKLGAFARMQAEAAAKNFRKLLKNPEARLKAYKPHKPLGFVPVGQKKGVVQLPVGHPHFLVAVKQKDLFASSFLK